MIHYTCDRCKRQIDIANQTRYVVQIEIQSAQEGCFAATEDDIDHLAELHQVLEGLTEEEFADAAETDETTHRGSYDLCPECHKQFMQNPLGRDAMVAIGFSNN